jgi:hypothetical protein
MNTCAKCGEMKVLCHSAKIEGIQQPRVCKECLTEMLSTGDENINGGYWIKQLHELNDTESLDAISKEMEAADGPVQEEP